MGIEGKREEPWERVKWKVSADGKTGVGKLAGRKLTIGHRTASFTWSVVQVMRGYGLTCTIEKKGCARSLKEAKKKAYSGVFHMELTLNRITRKKT